MRNKIIGIMVCMLMMTAVGLPAVGTMNKKMEKTTINVHQPVVEWKKTFDRGEFDYFQTVRQTDDGGYIASGTTEESNMYYVWLVKLASNGSEEWSVVNYDLNYTVMSSANLAVGGLDVQQTSDGGYIIVGDSWCQYEFQGVTYGESNMFLWKINATGTTQWLKHYYNETDEYAIGYMCYNVIEVDNGFVASGTYWSGYPNNNSWSANGCIMKTDSQGVEQWVRDFDKGGNDSLPSVYHTSDGGYFLSGFTDAATTNNGALWMLKTNADGVKQWDTLFDGPQFEYTYGKGGIQTSDGGYIMDGVSQSYGHGGADVWLIKTDSNGDMVWNNTFGDTRNDYCWGMCNADNDGVALAICKNFGYTGGSRDDILIIETDKDGIMEWKLDMAENGSQITRFIDPTTDGGYIATAMTNVMGNTNSNAIVLKLSSFDNQQPSKPVADGPARAKVGKNATFTATASDPDGDTLSYKWDWGDGNYSEWLSSSETTYSWAYKGTFNIRVMTMDEHSYESLWSDPIPIKIPCSFNTPIMQFWMKLFERFPNAFPLLRYFVGY